MVGQSPPFHAVPGKMRKGQGMALLSIYLLGPMRVTIDDQLVTGFETEKVRALLDCLAA